VGADATLYTTHFGLREAPFRATPDPRFFYSNPVYREAYATLLYGVLHRKGFIALTGEVGTGKTTLLRRLMDELGAPVRFVLFYNTTLTFDETVEFICGELDLPVDGLSRVQRLQRLNDLLIAEARQGGNVVLLIDEAQNLGPDVLENLRLISNLETSTEKLLQIVLVGQPELDAKLADPALRQVAQRIAVRTRLEALRGPEVAHFIEHRLRQCGGRCRELLTADAVRRVAAYSRGVPRLINILCDSALLSAYGTGATRVTGAMVDEVASDLKLSRSAAAPSGRTMRAVRILRWATPSLALVALIATAVALLPGQPLTAKLGDGAASPLAMWPAAISPSPPTAPASAPLVADHSRRALAAGGGPTVTSSVTNDKEVVPSGAPECPPSDQRR
jgi:general secretion pathway protein A